MATKTKTRRWIPCQSYDLEAMESWLEEMARCGWRLEQVGCFGCTAAFAAAAPQMVRYRLTSAMDADTFGTEAWLGPSEESRCLYAAYGWEYVAKRGPFYIYRTRDPAAREVDTDPHTQALVLRSLHRRARESLLTLVLLFFLVYPLTLNWWEILRTLWQHAPAAFLLYLILFLWITGVLPGRARHYRCLCRQLEAGQSLDHGDPLASPGPPVSAGQRPAPGAAGGLPGSRRVAQAGLMRDYSSRLIFWMAFFSRREIWAWEIPIRAETSIWVFPQKIGDGECVSPVR